MSLTPYAVPTFSGLNLVNDPEEVGSQGSIDLLNVELDDRGRARSRDGYGQFTAVPWAARLDSLAYFYLVDGSKFLLSHSGVSYIAYDSIGAVFASDTLGSAVDAVDYTRFGGPLAELIYVAGYSNSAGAAPALRSFDGVAWAIAVGAALGGVYPFLIEVQSSDNRLVGVFATSNFSRVGFSRAGDPEVFDAANFVDLTPGDGEKINALVGWREYVFAFKESKFFVFTGNSVGGTGLPEFNYRPVTTGVGAVAIGAAVGTPRGVFFVDRRGVYLTTGDVPVLVSRAIDPIFLGGANTVFQGGELNQAARGKVRLTWHNERLYVAYPSGSATTNDRMLVFDPDSGSWTLWNIAANNMISYRVDDQSELVFTYATGSFDIGRINSTFTSDDGVDITAHYQSGFYEPNPGQKTTTRWTKLWGTGAPTLNIFTNHATTDPFSRGAQVILGTYPQVAQGIHQKSYQGELFSHKIQSTDGDAWSVNRLEHDMAFAFQPQ